ncbi:AFG1 family ATPase [Psychrosphaera ytuae]|uniref:Cell division protein ZapE n=1 Tax=Psychrosphaera ytuae TaxID=2820710 RepID=A0A975DBU8_9GAMM|nr:cell division protein ZapE [Psychrosphaera ytuae]QTH63446.1 AFG1 family ATPase [Psychrosphaera ytuae]
MSENHTNNTPWQQYQSDLQRSDFQHDSAQENAVKHLQRLYEDLTAAPTKQSLWQKLTGKKPEPVQGIYFWGGVGRGKTYLVDTFYHCLPFDRKLRIHFHRFMHKVHDQMKALQGQEDPLKIVAKNLAEEARVICFDEFFVSDITDAMILGTLLDELFKLGVVFVTTSNIVPDELYRNGLQRARFLPAIALLNKHCDVVNVDSGVDYRLRTLEQAEIYHYPLEQSAEENLAKYFKQLAPEEGNANQSIEIEGRNITTNWVADGVVWFDFKAICKTARSQLDYIEISRIYHTVLLSNVEQMGKENDDAARRFISMIDEFYERKVKLIISAQVKLEELYGSGGLEFEFKRCVSRLQEMQSHEYLAEPHIP